MSSSDGDDEEREFSDSTDYDDYETSDSDNDEFDFDEDDDDDEDEDESSPIHFRECLRLLDVALTIDASLLPSWCGSGSLGMIDDPMILINGYRRPLSLPMNKRESKRFLSKASPFEMKIDLIDGISFEPSAFVLPSSSFRLTNSEWKTNVENVLKSSCVGQILDINPTEIDLEVSQLILLESSSFPRRFRWKKDQHHRSSIGKLFVTLPSTYKGGKETIRFYKEKHTFDFTDEDRRLSTYFTFVPLSDECEHEIDLISSGSKLVLVYDVIPLKSTTCYNVSIEPNQLERVRRVLDLWIDGLTKSSHGYSTKIVLPFSDSFQLGENPLLNGHDRCIGTILRRTIEENPDERFLLYQGVVQPNRSSDGTIHACRILTQLQRIRTTNDKTNSIFDLIESCQGNCNETYSGNIFLRRKRSEQGKFIPIEQFTVPIWCLVPFEYRYELFIDHFPRLINSIDENLDEIFPMFKWILTTTTTKKISLNWKNLLHQFIRLYRQVDEEKRENLNEMIEKLFQHRKFIDEFFPMNNEEEYFDLIFILKNSSHPQIQLQFHQLFVEVLKRRSRDSDRYRDAIKLIGILATNNIDSSFILALVHQLLPEMFHSMPTMTDLTNLLALLAHLTDAYQPSCEILVEQIIRQIKISTTTTTNTSLITNFLRTVLVPTLIEISHHYVSSSTNSLKRKRDYQINYPFWFKSLYQTCFSSLNHYCSTSISIPFYSNISKLLHLCRCSYCEQLVTFLRNRTLFEQTFLIPNDQFNHFNTMTNHFEPLLIFTRSMTSDGQFQQIHLMKMSKYDEELWRENNLLRSLLSYIPISTQSDNDEQQQSDVSSNKRFKCS